MKAKDVMTKEVITIPHRATYEEAVRILHENHISGAPVVDEKDHLVGIISEKDLFRGLFPKYGNYYKRPEAYVDLEAREAKIEEIKSDPVENFMIPMKDVVSILPNTPILMVGAIMLARGFHRMPVMEDGKIVGLVTRDQIYGSIFKKYLGL